MASQPRRITLVADEMLGHTRTGGIGTATTHLALALGRMGHRVELLYTGDEPRDAIAPRWAELYAGAGVAVRVLRRSGDRIEPAYFARPHDIELDLAADPPDVVIAQDLAAPASTMLRTRQLGRGFERTLFVVYCHGSRRWITDTARKVRVLPGAHAVTILEQASVELADVVVSPSAYLLDWMRGERWALPERAFVIPILTLAGAMGEAVAAPPASNAGTRLERIAFFGRLEERKGLQPFLAGLNALDPALLEGIELEFVGAATPAWPPQRIAALLSANTKRALHAVRFETELDQPEALAELSRPGTLAIMPSLGETFSNAVYECLERQIPFLASDAGAPRELVADEDRDRVLFRPTAAGVERALRRVLTTREVPAPARAALDPHAAADRWREVVELQPEHRPVETGSADADWTIVGDAEPDATLVEHLTRAQAASGADVVTCGIRLPSGAQHFFLGDPGGLGLLANHYGTIALLRRELLEDEPEPLWPLLARLAADGARIVSAPAALAAQDDPPADVVRGPLEALRVAHEFDRRLPASVRDLGRLTAGLAAAHARPRPQRRKALGVLRRLVHR